MKAADLEHHEVERLGELTDLVTTGDVDVLSEVAGCDTARAFGKLGDGLRESARRQNRQKYGEPSRDHSDDDTVGHDLAHREEHRFLLGLHDRAPAERPQKRDRGVPIPDGCIRAQKSLDPAVLDELEVDRTTRLAAGVLKRFHDSGVRDVDPFIEGLGVRVRHQLSARVDHIYRPPIVALLPNDLLDRLQADHGGDDTGDDRLSLSPVGGAYRRRHDDDGVEKRLGDVRLRHP